MSTLRPFPGLVVRSEWADRVTTGPYDAYSPAERAEIGRTNPYSFLNVTRSQEDVPADQRNDVDALIDSCATAMQRLYDADVYEAHGPALFLYRMAIEGHVQTGVMGLVPVTEDDDRRILRHEAVRPERTVLLARHLVEVGASSSPVSLTYRTDDALDDRLRRMCDTEPVLESHSEGVDQTVWVVTGDDACEFMSLLADRPLYVTDGHHRLAAAAAARRSDPTAEPLQWVQAVLFPDRELLVLPFHRRIHDRQGRSASQVAADLAAITSLRPCADADDARPDGPGRVSVYAGGCWYAADLPAASGDRAVDRLDVSRLQAGLLAPVFGIDDPSSDPAIDYVPDPVGLDALMARCDADGAVGFVMHATSVAELMAVADANELMPPKSSYFEPKPRSGVFVRRLDRESGAASS